ncbi:unnamed protein product [Clonostachys rosea]|uniref:Protein kinase domain-containing protein n=1 Tax=Bionectria ochroleuca TaxID=29856 RepID=A0ABY6UNN2_BIOOC|nr:unnamed protein product [Clonostachys rosea]
MSDPDISVASLQELVRGSQLPTTFESNGQLIIHARSTRRRAAQEKWIVRKRLGSGVQAFIDLQERVTAGSGSPQLRAVKNLKIPDGGRERSRELYQRELEAIAKFSQAKYSDHFVTSFGWFLSSQFIHIAMEYCELGDLDKYMSNPSKCPNRRLPESEVHEISSQILEALDVMHRESFCHRDLKLANILIMSTTPSWWVKLADFGLTKRNEATMPETTAIRGTPNYMPPELLGCNGNGNKADQYAVDMWCLGQCVYRLFTGTPIFANPHHLFQYSYGHESFPDLPLRKYDASANLINYIKRLVAVDPSDRLSSANALYHPWITSGYSGNDPHHTAFSQNYYAQESTSGEASAAWPDESSYVRESSRETRPYASGYSSGPSVEEPSASWPADGTAKTAFRVEITEPDQEVPRTWTESDMTSTWDAGETVQTNLSNDGQEPSASVTDGPTPYRVETADSYKVAGNKFFKEGNYDRAIEEYSIAIRLIPSSSTYLGNRAAAYMLNGQLHEALADCRGALYLAPDNRKLLLRLVRIHTLLGEAQEAVRTLERVKNPKPTEKEAMKAKAMFHDYQLALGLLGQIPIKAENMQLVISAMNRAKQLQAPSARTPWEWVVMLATAHLNLYAYELDTEKRAASLEEAKSQIDWLRSFEKDHGDALFLYARLLYSQGQDEEAIQMFESATRSTSYCHGAQCNTCKDGVKWFNTVRELSQLKEQGNSAFKKHDWNAAKNLYNRALVVDKANKLTNAKLYQNRARCYIKLGSYQAAIEDCTKAINLDATYVKAQATKATATELSGNLRGAWKEWKLVQKLSPEDSQAIKKIRSLEKQLAEPQRSVLEEIKAKDGDLSTSLCSQELYHEAAEVQKELFEVELKRAGTKKDQRVLNTMHTIYHTLSTADRVQEALPICREVLELQEELFGLANANTLLTLRNLGFIMMTLRHYADAAPIWKKALSVSSIIHGSMEESTVECKHYLAMVLTEESRYEEALLYLQAVLEWKKTFQGEEDMRTVGLLHEVGDLLNRLGRASEAEPLLRDAVRLRKRHLGTSHEDTQSSVEALSLALTKLGLFE